MPANPLFRTRDLGEAAALLCSGYQLKQMSPEGSFFWFEFANSKSIQETSREYWFGSLRVPAKEFRTHMNTLKNRVFDKGY